MWEQWRSGSTTTWPQLWLRFVDTTNKVVLHEPVPVQPASRSATLEVGWSRQRSQGRPCTVEVTNAPC